jgi:hypothetical protein
MIAMFAVEEVGDRTSDRLVAPWVFARSEIVEVLERPESSFPAARRLVSVMGLGTARRSFWSRRSAAATCGEYVATALDT